MTAINKQEIISSAQGRSQSAVSFGAMLTLLVLVAVIGLASSTNAQTNNSYSIHLRFGWNVIANHLSRGNNSLAEVLPHVPSGSVVYQWNATNHAYRLSTFDPDNGGWDDPTLTLSPGQGVFLQNPSPTPFILTFVGETISPRLPLSLPYSTPALVARQIPAPATYEEITGLPPAEGTKLYRYDSALQADPLTLSNWFSYSFQAGAVDSCRPNSKRW
jgi:hypothetical protein